MGEQSAGIRVRLARARRTLFVPSSVTAAQEKTSKQVARQARQLEQVVTQLSDIKEQLRPLTIASNHRDAEHELLTAQMGALEERMGRIEERLGTGRFVTDDEQQVEARGLVEEIRAQHEQIRVRLQIVAHYEERLRRLEGTVKSLSGLSESEARHLV